MKGRCTQASNPSSWAETSLMPGQTVNSYAGMPDIHVDFSGGADIMGGIDNTTTHPHAHHPVNADIGDATVIGSGSRAALARARRRLEEEEADDDRNHMERHGVTQVFDWASDGNNSPCPAESGPRWRRQS